MSTEYVLTLNPAGVTNSLINIQKNSAKHVLFGLRSIETTNNFVEPHDLSDNEGFFVYYLDNKEDLPAIQKQQYKKWLIKKGIEDLMKGISLTLIDAYCYGSLYAAKDAMTLTDQFLAVREKAEKEAHKLALPNLITHLTSKFLRDRLVHEQDILSINKVRNCLVHRDGFVTDKDVNHGADELMVSYKRLKIIKVSTSQEITAPTSNDSSVRFALEPATIQFKIGDHLDFNFRNFNDFNFTCSRFGQDLVSKLFY
jgi:hypothetical protein